jgi:hypothetical protein
MLMSSYPSLTTTKRLCSEGSDYSNEHFEVRFYSGSSVMSLSHPSLMWPSVATRMLLRPFSSSDERQLMSHELVATQGHNINGHSVISPGPVVIKSHNSRAVRLVPPHLQKGGLTHISTCLHQVHCRGNHGYAKLISRVSMNVVMFFL